MAIETVDASFDALYTHMERLMGLIHHLGGLDALDHMTLSTSHRYVLF